MSKDVIFWPEYLFCLLNADKSSFGKRYYILGHFDISQQQWSLYVLMKIYLSFEPSHKSKVNPVQV